MTGHRVLQAITPSRLGGAEMVLVRMAPRLRERGHHLHIVCNSGSRGLGALRQALRQSDTNLRALPIGGKANPRALPALLREIRRSRSRFSHSHLSSASWWCGWLDRMQLCRSVGHVQGMTNALWHRGQSRLIACSQAVKDHQVAQGIEAARVTVLYNPVEPADVQVRRPRDEVRRELGAAEDVPVVGTFALLGEKKGWRELMHAIPLVLREHPKAQFWCAGEGPLRPELDRLAGPNVKVLGFRHDVADLMNAIDVMALPSHCEPFGIVYVEAALLGKPSVACNAGGAPEVIVPGQTGLLVPPFDGPALATALIAALGDPGHARRMGEAAKQLALEKFGWRPFLQGLELVYDSMEQP